jgi:hypothetical protein
LAQHAFVGARATPVMELLERVGHPAIGGRSAQV